LILFRRLRYANDTCEPIFGEQELLFNWQSLQADGRRKIPIALKMAPTRGFERYTLFSPTEKHSAKILAKTTMVRFAFSQIEAGWALANVSDDGADLAVTASYTPTDAIRDFVDAVASLRTVASAHCCWFQEPGEMHWQFLRSKGLLTVEVIRFAGVLSPRRHGPDGVSVFKAETKWVEFARQVLKSMLKIRDSLGSGGYSREWGHAFPQEACEKLGTAIREAENNERER
jgi:hypothetical protein